jgi:hypothetical protein
MGANPVRSRSVLCLPALFMLATVCLVMAAFALRPATAGAENEPTLTVTVGVGWQSISGFNYTPGTVVSVQVFDSPGGSVVWAASATADQDGRFDLGRTIQGFPALGPGMMVKLTASGTPDRELTIRQFTMDPIDTAHDTVSGAVADGTQVSVNVFNPGGLQPSTSDHMMVMASGGRWLADFGLAHGPDSQVFDITQSTNVNATIVDADGDAQMVIPPPTPSISVTLGRGSFVGGSSFTANDQVNVEIVADGQAPVHLAATTDGNGNFSLTQGALGSVRLTPGMRVTVTDSHLSRSLLIPTLTFDLLDAQADTASGTADPGTQLTVHLNASGMPPQQVDTMTVTADADGNWVARFGAEHDVDVMQNMFANAMLRDDSGNWIAVNSPPTPTIGVNLGPGQGIFGGSWTPGATVTLRLFNSEASGGGLIWEKTVAAGGDGSLGLDQMALGPQPLEPGMSITATAGRFVKELTIAAFTFAQQDPDTDRLSGTAPAGRQVTVNLSVPGQQPADMMTVTAGSDGSWLADFSTQHGTPLHTFNVVSGMFAMAWMNDDDGDMIMAGSPPVPSINVSLGREGQNIGGWNWPANTVVTLEVYASAENGAPRQFDTTVTTNADSSFNVEYPADLGGLGPGMLVVASDGHHTKKLTIARLSFDVLNATSDTASGTAAPEARVTINISVPGQPAPSNDMMTVTADQDGNWVAAFGTPHGDGPHVFDITPGMMGGAWVSDEDGDNTNVGSPPIPAIAGQIGEGIYGWNFEPGGTVALSVFEGDAERWSTSVSTDDGGAFSIDRDALPMGLTAGMRIVASDTKHTKELLLDDQVSFNPLDPDDDVASGHAPAGSIVQVDVWSGDTSAGMTVTADGDGLWTARFAEVGFDIVAHTTDGQAQIQDADGDFTCVTPRQLPWFYAGNRSGIAGSGFAADAAVDIRVLDGDTTVQSIDDEPTDASGWFNVEEWRLEQKLESGMVVEVSDGSTTKELAIEPLTISANPSTGTVCGTGPAGKTAFVDVWAGSDWYSADARIGDDGFWSVNFDPFAMTSDTNASVGVYDADGDANSEEWYPPRLDVFMGRWDWCEGQDFTQNTQLNVSLFESGEQGARLLYSATPTTDDNGWFYLGFNPDEGTLENGIDAIDLAPEMKLVVSDPASGVTKETILPNLWVIALDPVHDSIRGVAPPGSSLWVQTGDDGTPDFGQWQFSVGETGTWLVNAAPLDLTWTTWGEASLQDDDGDTTDVDTTAPTINGNLFTDVVDGQAFSRNTTVAASIFATQTSETPMWSGDVPTDAAGHFTLSAAAHSIDLLPGMHVVIEDNGIEMTKELTLVPLTYDELSAATWSASGTAQPGSDVHIFNQSPPGAGEAGVPVAGASGDWVWDFPEWGRWDTAYDTQSWANVSDAENDATVVPFVPHIDDLQYSDGTFSWTPSASAARYSWVIDHTPTTVPDQVSEGTATSHTFTDLTDGVWYFHVRVQGGEGMYDGGGLWGRASHLQVEIVTTPVGDDQTVTLPGDVSVTFDSVTSSGTTSVAASATDPGPQPAPFQVADQTFYQFETTASYTGPITVAVPYEPGNLTLEQQGALRLMHLDDGVWTDVTRSVDTTAHLIYGEVDHFSWFAIAGGVRVEPVNADGSSVFKLKSTIPLRLKLLNGAGQTPDGLAPRLYLSKLSNNIWGDEQEPVGTNAPDSGNRFVYLNSSEGYKFNLGTRQLTVGTWRLRIELAGGTRFMEVFSLR